jgi:hypothetical protein
MGAAIKKDRVTPNGTPAVTKPIKRGTAEQEQKGVTIPKSAAKILPTDSRLPANIFLVLSLVKNVRIIPTPKTTKVRSIITLGVSYRKNWIAAPRWLPWINPNKS